MILTIALVGWCLIFVLLKIGENYSHGKVSEWLDKHNITFYLGYVSISLPVEETSGADDEDEETGVQQNRTKPENGSLARAYVNPGRKQSTTPSRIARICDRLRILMAHPNHQMFWRAWFELGIYAGFIMFLFSVCILSINLFATIHFVYQETSMIPWRPPISDVKTYVDQMAMSSSAESARGGADMLSMAGAPMAENLDTGIEFSGPMSKGRMPQPPGAAGLPEAQDAADPAMADPGVAVDHNAMEGLVHSRGSLMSHAGSSLSMPISGPEPMMAHYEPGSVDPETISSDEYQAHLMPAAGAEMIASMDNVAHGPLTAESDAMFSNIERRPKHGQARSRSMEGARPSWITPLIPGVTSASSDILYLMLALTLSTIWHEFGHFVGAIAEGLSVSKVGMFVALVFPGAFVKVEEMNTVSQRRRLSILCAGSWHNLFLGMLCVVLMIMLPILLLPLYQRGAGCAVVRVQPGSPFFGVVSQNDVIKSIGGIPTSDTKSFAAALQTLASEPQNRGFCANVDMVMNDRAMEDSQCCYEKSGSLVPGWNESRVRSSGHSQKPSTSGPEGQKVCTLLPRYHSMLKDNNNYGMVESETLRCLPASLVKEAHVCITDNDCSPGSNDPVGSTLRCVYPLTNHKFSAMRDYDLVNPALPWNRQLRLIQVEVASGYSPFSKDIRLVERIRVKNAGLNARHTGAVAPVADFMLQVVPSRLVGIDSRFLLFEGTAQQLSQSMHLSDFRLRWWLLKSVEALPKLIPMELIRKWTVWCGALLIRSIILLNLPRKLYLLLYYTCSISLCLGILNMAPVYYLDGEESCALFVDMITRYITSMIEDREGAWSLFPGLRSILGVGGHSGRSTSSSLEHEHVVVSSSSMNVVFFYRKWILPLGSLLLFLNIGISLYRIG